MTVLSVKTAKTMTMTIETLTGTFDRDALKRLTWPIAWSGQADLAYSAALATLSREGLEAIAATPDAVAVEIEQGVITSVLIEEGWVS